MHLRPKPVKKFTCKLCMKDFRSGQTLKSHTNFVHEGKGEKCDICFVELSDTIAIRRHKKAIHERQIMYECDSCGKTFNEEGNLRCHVKTVHEKNAEKCRCETCGKDYSDKGNLKKHIARVHQKFRYSCKTCGKSYSSNHNLISHNLKHHS